MSPEKIASLSPEGAKLYIYLIHCLMDDWLFDISCAKNTTNTTEQDFFYTLLELFEADIIDMSLSDEDGSISIIIRDNEVKIPLEKMSNSSLGNLKRIIFTTPEMGMLFDQTIAFWGKKAISPKFSKTQLQTVQTPPTPTEERVEDVDPKIIVNYLYKVLYEQAGIKIDRKTTYIEVSIAKSLVKLYPKMGIDDFRAAIDWFFAEPFWKKVIINMSGVKKHMPRYLASSRGKKNPDQINRIMSKII
jgi:hypothetical protein